MATLARRLFGTRPRRKLALIPFLAPEYHTTAPHQHAINHSGSSIIAPGKIDKRIINKNMTLRYSNVITSFNSTTNLSSGGVVLPDSSRPALEATGSEDLIESEDSGRDSHPLVIMMPWMLANETALEKYRQIYLRRGFDVLTVRTSPLQLILPTSGAQKVAEAMVAFLAEAASQYQRMIIHAFSVGIYQFGEVLMKMTSSAGVPVKKSGAKKGSETAVMLQDELIATFKDRIRGLVFDSALRFESVPTGMSRAMFPDSRPGMQRFTEAAFRAYMKYMNHFSTRHYIASQDIVHNNPLRTPGLLLVSEKDKFAAVYANETLARAWKSHSIPVTYKLWTDCPHVGMYRKHPQEYEEAITNFLKSIDLEVPNPVPVPVAADKKSIK